MKNEVEKKDNDMCEKELPVDLVFAPIRITTLCRDKHFIRLMESLKKNTWAKYTDVYVAVDYPLNDQHKPGYNNICKYLKTNSFNEFSSITIIYRDYNYGAVKNAYELSNTILKKHDRIIILEDDLEVSPVFIEYMDKCLHKYQERDDITAVCAYSYPIDWKVSSHSTVLLHNFTAPTWGIGFWKNKYDLCYRELRKGFLKKSFVKTKKNGKIKEMINGRRFDYEYFYYTGAHDILFYVVSDMALGIYNNIKQFKVVSPVVSKVINHGFDGSGVYCSSIRKFKNTHSLNYDYDNQVMDKSMHFEIVEDKGEFQSKNKQIINRFLYVTIRQRVSCLLLSILYRIGGIKLSSGFYDFIKRIRNIIKH